MVGMVVRDDDALDLVRVAAGRDDGAQEPLRAAGQARIDERLHDGDELPVLGGMRVVHTPGHTPGHVALYFPQMALLIAGDALELRAGRLRGPAAAVTADMPQAMASVARLAQLEIDVIAFSHFPRLPRLAGEALRALAGVASPP